MLVKLGKQVKLPGNNHFTIKYGTINALEPKAIFVSIHSWAIPRHNQRFDKKLRRLTLTVKNKIHEEIDRDVFHQRHIVDFDLRESGLQKNKQSFMAIEITLYPKNVIPFPADIYDQTITTLVGKLSVLIKKDRNFSFADKKQK